MAKIDTIHFLVYPVFYEERAERKEKLWERNIRDMAGKRNSLFVMLRCTEISALTGREKALTTTPIEEKLIKAGKVLEDRFIHSSSLHDILDQIKDSHTFARNVWITAYGQHADACVTNNTEDFRKALDRNFPWAKFRSIEHRGYSAKMRGSLIKVGLEKHRPDLMERLDEGEIWALRNAYENRGFTTREFRKAVRRAGDANDFFDRLNMNRSLFRRLFRR